MVATCAWRMHTVDSEGTKQFTGKTCGLKLCERHGMRVGQVLLCRWHHTVAAEQGLIKVKA